MEHVQAPFGTGGLPQSLDGGRMGFHPATERPPQMCMGTGRTVGPLDVHRCTNSLLLGVLNVSWRFQSGSNQAVCLVSNAKPQRSSSNVLGFGSTIQNPTSRHILDHELDHRHELGIPRRARLASSGHPQMGGASDQPFGVHPS